MMNAIEKFNITATNVSESENEATASLSKPSIKKAIHTKKRTDCSTISPIEPIKKFSCPQRLPLIAPAIAENKSAGHQNSREV